MKKLIYVLAGVACALPAMEIEMKVIKKKIDYPNASPELLAAVLTVPAISKMLAERYVSCPIDITSVSLEDERIEVTNLKDNQTPFPLESINYFQCPTTQGLPISAELNDFFNYSVVHHDGNGVCDKFFFDGPNKDGFFLTNSTHLGSFSTRIVTNENRVNSNPDRTASWQNTWSIALSQNNIAAFSSMSTKKPNAYFELYECSQEDKRKDTIQKSCLGQIRLQLKKKFTLIGKAFHFFTKLSFLTGNLILGLDQSGQLYTVEPYIENDKKLPKLHHLAFKGMSFSSIVDFSLDSYDKHTILMVDKNKNVHLGKITSNKLITKKITSLTDLQDAVTKNGNVANELLSIRMAGNICYFTFQGQSDKQQILVTFTVGPLQCSLNQKIQMLKAQMRHKVT